ncbi:NADP-dependent 3-hydroxy acid dehydrogenase YdfG [Hymenobacter daecheongensis DSM 21074]|uniref:NADP-dependent 3-hydroxy acid dehydrogenase YdfG n=1 Tax=Hymenobacter daecheongensis DSM 21074 TaxID=1121955 RepID=A0A1M6CS50_9BACT|nr:SDR family oxidoreductase [Hymenobacter daecheongensis]SHI63693.1 NADP-dependent 3-hydroxy acid dehydrogenase YdfG [Hymenobacter daecheongensis DSM 21074]
MPDAQPRPAPVLSPGQVRPGPFAEAGRDAFAGKVALVTGSESGIGRETARALCRQGAAVVLNGRNAQRLAQTRQEFEAAGFAVTSCVADVTDYAACEELIAAALEAFGQLDILVTNASISQRAYFADMRPEVFRQVLDSNVYGTVYPLKAALPHLTRARGSVTFISSISALNGMPSGSAYCAGKAAVANLAHTLRLELAHTGIHFGVVHIGFTQNDPDKRVLDAAGQPVPIAHRPPRWQKSQAEVAAIILDHIRRRRQRTVISTLGRLIVLIHTYLPRLGDWIVLTTTRRLRHFYE